MILLIILLTGICVYGMQPVKCGSQNYLSLEQTTVIKGIFSLIIILSHLKGYIVLDTPNEITYSQILSKIGQLMVAAFIFYSGYGVIYGLDNKKNYEKTFFVNRLLRTWFKFAIAVVLFFIMNICLGIKDYSPTAIFLSVIGWESIGNSNWFMFDMFVFYFGIWVLSLIRRLIIKNNDTQTLRSLTVYCVFSLVWTILMIIILRRFKDSWWYDTLLCFPFGTFFYLFKEKFEKIWSKRFTYIITGVALYFLFLLSYIKGGVIFYNICAGLFCLIILWINFKFKIGNKFLYWVGAYSFYIYIYMRIPMIILSDLGLNKYNLIFSVASIILTFTLAFLMKKVQDRLECIIFVRRKT